MISHRTISRTKAGTTRAIPLLLVAAALPALHSATPAGAKTPGRSYCFLGRCHRVLTLDETRLQLGRTKVLRASFYDACARDRFNPCTLTSSGEVFRPGAPDNAASPIYPDGTMLLLFYPPTGSAAVVRINNAGPYHTSRKLDVSVATAEALGFRSKGLAEIEVRVIAVPKADDAAYRRLRRYWPVHGPIGKHASIAEAHAALVRVSGLPRAPAHPDAALLVSLPALTLAQVAPQPDDAAVMVGAPARTHAVPPPRETIGPVPPAPSDRPMGAEVLRPGVVALAPAGAEARDLIPVVAAAAGLESLRTRGPTTKEAGLDLLASLRARARHGLKPGRLPDVRLDAAIAWLSETAASIATHARAAARARLEPRARVRVASSEAGVISRR